MLSRLANLHGVMRGMFPLQVIRCLRGSGVVERLNREGEVVVMVEYSMKNCGEKKITEKKGTCRIIMQKY